MTPEVDARVEELQAAVHKVEAASDGAPPEYPRDYLSLMDPVIEEWLDRRWHTLQAIWIIMHSFGWGLGLARDRFENRKDELLRMYYGDPDDWKVAEAVLESATDAGGWAPPWPMKVLLVWRAWLRWQHAGILMQLGAGTLSVVEAERREVEATEWYIERMALVALDGGNRSNKGAEEYVDGLKAGLADAALPQLRMPVLSTHSALYQAGWWDARNPTRRTDTGGEE